MGAHTTIEDYMTRSPLTIGADQPLSVAHQLMRQHHLRHLPVLEHGKLVGILSLGDLHLVETLRDVEQANTTVAEAMSFEPYTVDQRAPLVDVLRTMEERKYGSTIVVEGRKVIGIFTTHDAMHALRVLLDKEEEQRRTPSTRSHAAKRS
jgi:acetoin utilization protein AcuB